MTITDMRSVHKITCYLSALALLGLLWVSVVPSAAAQDDDPIDISKQGGVYVDNPPEELESGSLLELFAGFREGEHQIHFEFESDADIVPVRFQTLVRKDGETLGRSSRDPMPYFPGDMLMCPETWEFIAMLSELTDEEGLLPPGEYVVVLFAEGVETEGTVEPAEIQFVVPER